jgi:protein-S-isoprenylcysteine O-methyltransferase Ste14
MSQPPPPVRSSSPAPSAYAPPPPIPEGERQSRHSFMELLSILWVDRTIAIVASAPLAIELYRRYTSADLSFPRAVLGINTAVLIITMLVRRPPKRVTPNPWFWLLAFVATYGILAIAAFGQRGQPLVPWWVSNGLAVLSVAISVWGRLSLGRNIGFVPAQRQLALRGAYRFMRHPIYTGLFLSLAGFILRAYSVPNMIAALTVIALFMIKSVIEERFLRQDPEYAEYLARVRWRWVPGVA